jgi:hypothetical protein
MLDRTDHLREYILAPLYINPGIYAYRSADTSDIDSICDRHIFRHSIVRMSVLTVLVLDPETESEVLLLISI